MAMLTQRGNRADLLLTLARLALPDAVGRSKQPLAAAILFAVLFLMFSTVVTLVLLPAIFAIESDALRRNLLILIACILTAIALLGQVALRAPVTWLLDLEDLLRLPVGFRDLFGLRFALSTTGYWLPLLGPAGVYLAVMRSGSVVGVPITLLAILSLVWIFGRTAAILSVLANRSVEGRFGALALVAITGAVHGAIVFGGLALAGELDAEGITRAIEQSAALGALGYTPPGLVAGIVHEPGPSASNLARLGGLAAILGALTALENRLLLRDYLERPGGDRRTASGSLPVTRLLRKAKRLTPTGTLTLIEIECLLRLKPARVVLATALGVALVTIPILGGFMLVPAAIIGVILNDLRVSKQPPTCHAWRESLTLPFQVWRIFRGMSRRLLNFGSRVAALRPDERAGLSERKETPPMSNHGSREGNRQERRSTPSSPSSGSGLGLLESLPSLVNGLSSFQELCVETGRSTLVRLMEEERESRCGAKGRHQDARSVWRAGSAPSQVTLGGARIEIQRLRVRGPEGEVRLESFEWAASRDAMDRHTMEAIASGVSTRNYLRSLDTAAAGSDRRSASRSSVSRRFKALSARQMEKFLSSSLEDEDIRVVGIVPFSVELRMAARVC